MTDTPHEPFDMMAELKSSLAKSGTFWSPRSDEAPATAESVHPDTLPEIDKRHFDWLIYEMGQEDQFPDDDRHGDPMPRSKPANHLQCTVCGWAAVAHGGQMKGHPYKAPATRSDEAPEVMKEKFVTHIGRVFINNYGSVSFASNAGAINVLSVDTIRDLQREVRDAVAGMKAEGVYQR